MPTIDFSQYKDVPVIGFQPFGQAIMDVTSHPLWDIPAKVGIVAAPTGAFITKEQNPNQPYTVDEILAESIGCVEAGACSVHVHVREENGFPSGNRDLTEQIVSGLRRQFGSSVHIDGEALFGKDFEETMEPIVEDFYESAAVNCHADFMGDTLSYLGPQACKATTEVLQAYGKKPLLAVYNPGDIDNTYRWLIQSGIAKPPFAWIIVAGMPGGAPMWDPMSMTETLVYMLRRIRDVDPAPQPAVCVCACGRASSHLTALAIILGCSVRVGKEDTMFRYPHRNEVLTSNRQVVEETAALALLLGREPMTGAEYREAMGMAPLAVAGAAAARSGD